MIHNFTPSKVVTNAIRLQVALLFSCKSFYCNMVTPPAKHSVQSYLPVPPATHPTTILVENSGFESISQRHL